MNIKANLVGVIALLPFSALAGDSIDGWQIFKFGMTKEQAVAAAGVQGYVAYGKLNYPVDISGEEWIASPEFANSRIKSVNLGRNAVNSPAKSSEDTCKQKYYSLAKKVFSQYTVEVSPINVKNIRNDVYFKQTAKFKDGASIEVGANYVGYFHKCEPYVSYNAPSIAPKASF